MKRVARELHRALLERCGPPTYASLLRACSFGVLVVSALPSACASLDDLTGGSDDAGDAGQSKQAPRDAGSSDVGKVRGDADATAARPSDARTDVSTVVDAAHLADAAHDGARTGDTGAEAGSGDAGLVYSELMSPTAWTTFDTNDLGMSAMQNTAGGFSGGAFDGRYVYLAPSESTVVARFDTHVPADGFTNIQSWSTFDMAVLDNYCDDCSGAVFDGRYVYFVPADGVVTRYDSTLAFASESSWDAFDPSLLAPRDSGLGVDLSYQGAVFDGRYVYFVPYTAGAKRTDGGESALYSGRVVRFDTTGTFGSTTDWSTYDVGAGATPAASGFEGGIFDGRYLYLIPDEASVVARYDTTASFETATSWATYDLSAVAGSQDSGFAGGAFDGRYVYLVPSDGSVVVQFDTTASFTDGGSWETLDTTTLAGNASGFFGAAFDGRYVYFVPWDSETDGTDGLLVRYDTQVPFATTSSWNVFDTTSIAPNAEGFNGAVFDGQYLYFVPNTNDNEPYAGDVARFDSRTPPLTPKLPLFPGSFF